MSTVVQGEDRESDGEGHTAQGLAVPGEAPESDEEEIDTASISSVGSVVSPGSEVPSVRRHKKPHPAYNSLLHRKLRERNQSLRRSVNDLVSHALAEKEKELSGVSQSLTKTHTQMQDCLQVLRCLTGDLLRVQAKMDDFYDSPNLLPNIEFAQTLTGPDMSAFGAAALPPS